ncbi:MAG: uracil-DNA glycosylase [Candidatus Sericytochromatia bacterium]|nr:uracil-DNA glycosylase [Candidatus Sericytochromatia bacterium]
MCSTQLDLFSSDSQDNGKELNVKEKEAEKVTNSSENNVVLKPIKKSKDKPIAELTIEDKKIIDIELQIKEKETLNDQERNNYLNQVKEIASSCVKCVLSETRTKVVFSAGNPDSLIMLIGEGPGENEDKTGIPFVGRAGQLLDKILESAKISRENDLYIANVVKCRPPANRTPFEDEIDACSIYLKKQLELTNASIILLTGATAMKAILNSTSPISKVRGQWFEWNGKWVMPVFHPSYLLRNPSKEVGSPKWLMWQDIKKVKQKLDEIKG